MKNSKILGFNITFLEKGEDEDLLTKKNNGYYIFANSNTLVEGKYNALLNQSLKNANLVLPDGFPLALIARFKGVKRAKRLPGPDFTLKTINYLRENRLSCCFYGGSKDESEIRKKILISKFPNLRFLSFSEIEKKEMIKAIKKYKVNYLFVSLGSPKQEIWAYNNKNINCKIFCVGIATPYILGERTRAPVSMRKYHLEWIYRLITEPKNCWRRYLINGPKFILLSLNEIIFK
ncbi:MAG: WecB/TagA/CpsF family glycosyltransferase [Nanoarchaeota archaeon]|nr:WecB/TagA/CpsF family glycosyltransferase [Nanoarchaeota archaeon]